MWDVAIAGAGIAGLTCALTLQEAGYRVVAIEKSKGVGGRVATRRLHDTCVDHGAPILTRNPQDKTQYDSWVTSLIQQKLLQPWSQSKISTAQFLNRQWNLTPSHSSDEHYVVPLGMTAIAKNLAKTLNICHSQRVIELRLDREQSTWHLITESTAGEQPQNFQAKAVVLAIPAPQAIDLYTPLIAEGFSANVLDTLNQVRFDPCISSIVGYDASISGEQLSWSELNCQDDPIIRRMICDRRKRNMDSGLFFAIHSTPNFAEQNFEASDLNIVGQEMLNHLAQVYEPWMGKPKVLQVHRWRYAIATGGFPGQPLSAHREQPLWICGDWCLGGKIQDAFDVGLDVAQRLQLQLKLTTPKG